MAETLNRIRYRLGMDALVGFLNGPRAFSFQAGKTIVTVVSCHQLSDPHVLQRHVWRHRTVHPGAVGWRSRARADPPPHEATFH
jgi:hypothetical protein